MKLRGILLLLVALGAAAFTAIYAQRWISAERSAILASIPAERPQAENAMVLVADEDLAVGTFVKEGHMRWQPWPEDAVADGYAVKGQHKKEDFVGAVVRSAFVAGQPLTGAQLVHPGDRGFLAAVLSPGKRAVSVPVNATSGIAGFVFPGDWVDIILTVRFSVEDAKGKDQTRYFSETLLTDVRVLAVDQEIERNDGEAAVAKTATVEVTPKQVEKVAIGLEMGSLSLSLHSLARGQDRFSQAARAIGADAEEGGPERSYTLDMDVYYMRDLFAGHGGQKRRKQQVNVLRGGKSEQAAF